MQDVHSTAGGDAAPFRTYDEATEHLDRMCGRLAVRHLSYWQLTMQDGVPDDITWIATYDPAYMSQYMTDYTPLGDPAFDAAGSSVLAIDWADLSHGDATARDMHRRAERYGIGRHGLTFPLAARHDCKILFSVNVTCGDAEWPAEKARIIGPCLQAGRDFHGRMAFLIDSRRIAAQDR